jgi:hypothetical protein
MDDVMDAYLGPVPHGPARVPTPTRERRPRLTPSVACNPDYRHHTRRRSSLEHATSPGLTEAQ